MTVHHFNRDPRSGNYTFEQLFGALRVALSKHIEVVSHDLPAGMHPIKCMYWARRQAGIINHITGDVNYLALGLPSERTIITVHDLGHYTRSLTGWKKEVYRKLWLGWPFKRATHLTAISNFTKQQIIEHLNIPAQKISVIPDPLLPGFSFVPYQFHEEQPKILQIGSGSNKNLSRLIEAIKGLNVSLILVNQLNNKEIKRHLDESNINYEQRANLDFAELRQAYGDCDMLFFASEYEGFGMPILEAQATGRPVLTSNLASMPEIAGKDGAVLVDPFSIESIRSGIQQIIQSSSLRDQLITTGLKNVQRYNIDAIAQQYIQLYNML
jgi:glycosyltransferase involved in cell wall biosynthesis